MSMRLLTAGALGVLAVGGAGAAIVTGTDGDDADAQAASSSTATTRIERQDLVETETVDGTLGYSDVRMVINRMPGTITWTPGSGSVVRRNRILFEVEGKAAYLLDGGSPAYRTLRPGLTGDDVRQLERNLRELNLDSSDDMDVDGVWDVGTTTAVRRWQRRKGLEDDGSIEPGRIVFQPGSRRIGAIKQPVGSGGRGAAASLMTTTSVKRIVSVSLEASDADLAQEDAEVAVELPDGKTVKGTIVRVGTVAVKKPTQQEEDPPATIKVIIKLRSTRGVALDGAPVDVRLEKPGAKNVLTVPVTALLARQGGQFAVEVREGARRRVVAVQTGRYTDGDVEIEGRGLRSGMTVTDARV